MGKNKELLLHFNTEIKKCSKKFKINKEYIMDYVHDTYIKVVESFEHGYKEEGKLDAWVRTVAMNYMRTKIKYDNRITLCSFEEINEQKVLLYETNNYKTMEKNIIELAMCAIEELPPIDKEILSKRMNNESCSCIAREMNLNIKTVRKHLLKSYEKIKESVYQKHYEIYKEKLEW